MFLSKNPDKEFKNYKAKFKGTQDALLKLEFLTKDNKGNIAITPKGKILAMAPGINPLLTSSLIYDEKLKDLSPLALIETLGFIAGSDDEPDSDELANFVLEDFKNFIGQDKASSKTIKEFKDTKEAYRNYETKILKAQYESQTEFVLPANSFSGYISYLFAYLNSKNSDSISNFREITKKQPCLEKDYVIKEFNRCTQEGNVYRTLSRTVSLLKQLLRICEYTLSNPELYPNSTYYEKLKENAQLALFLIEAKPLNEEL